MSKFEIDILNYFDKQEFVAEICYDHVQWAEISQQGNTLTVKFYPHPKEECWQFSCEDAAAAITEAKKRLLKKINSVKSLFPALPEDPKEANLLGQQLLEEILKSTGAQVLPNRFGGKDVFHVSGKGARFNDHGEFLGFLQLR
ncbi:MAG: hypothetical protein V4494_03080 [Chlamydiota bacterium]